MLPSYCLVLPKYSSSISSHTIMSVSPDSALYVESVNRNGNPNRETFHRFFELWIAEQNQYLQELISASEATSRQESENSSLDVRSLVERVLEHYEHYYRTKSRWVKHDVLGMLTPSWTTSLEDAFLWIGGWRPSVAFHVLYSKSGLQLEAQLEDVIRGLSTGNLGDLTPRQLSQVDELQRRTIKEEKEITEKMAKQQETVADTSMVELSHVVGEIMRRGGREEGSSSSSNSGSEVERIKSILAKKKEALEELLQKADELRLKTLKSVIAILSPIQAVHFLSAAAELHLRFHEWGKKKDEDQLAAAATSCLVSHN